MSDPHPEVTAGNESVARWPSFRRRILVAREIRLLSLLATVLLGLALPGPAQDDLRPLEGEEAERINPKMLSSYAGTPLPVVEKMLELAQLRPEETLYDLGSGDGRILVMAVQKFGARAVGIELDPRLCRLSRERIRKLDLGPQVQIIEGDVLEQDLSAADVVTIFLTPYGIQKLRPFLEKFLHPGMRIVTRFDEIPGWKPTTSATVLAEDKKPYKLHLYVISKPSDWVSFSKFGHTP
jgi:predicted RNA methylase